MAKVDYTVQLLYNQKLKPLRAFAGDIVDAHHAAVRVAAKTYCTPHVQGRRRRGGQTPTRRNAQPYHGGRWIGLSVKEGRHRRAHHPASARLGPGALPQQTRWPAPAAPRTGTFHRHSPRNNPKGSHLIVYSQYMSRTMMDNYGTNTDFCTAWPDVVKILRERHKGSDVKVAVVPLRRHAAPGDRAGRLALAGLGKGLPAPAKDRAGTPVPQRGISSLRTQWDRPPGRSRVFFGASRPPRNRSYGL